MNGYRCRGVPLTYLIDAGGRIRMAFYGAFDPDNREFVRIFENLLKEKEVKNIR